MARPTPTKQAAALAKVPPDERGDDWITEAWRVADKLRRVGLVRDAQRLEDACEAAEQIADLAAATSDRWTGTTWRHAAEGVVGRVLSEPEQHDGALRVEIEDESGRRWESVALILQDWRRV